MKHIGCFSGGKDSTALMLWMKENIGVPGQDWTPVFCDTGWEHPITYAYVQEINEKVLNGSLVTLHSGKYKSGMRELVSIHHAIPHPTRRFCTDHLKIVPLHDYISSLDDEVTVYQGIRADESASRACMLESQWVNDAGGYAILRPLLRWTAERCFEFLRQHSVKPNPLYMMGAGRVGCFPCINLNLRELKAISQFCPEIRDRIIELQTLSGRPFFRPGYIPPRFCAAEFPTAEEVFRYVDSVDENQLPLLPARSCMSVYNLCE